MIAHLAAHGVDDGDVNEQDDVNGDQHLSRSNPSFLLYDGKTFEFKKQICSWHSQSKTSTEGWF